MGDVAGMGADLYESYCGSVLATAALGAAAFITVPELSLIHIYSLLYQKKNMFCCFFSFSDFAVSIFCRE